MFHVLFNLIKVSVLSVVIVYGKSQTGRKKSYLMAWRILTNFVNNPSNKSRLQHIGTVAFGYGGFSCVSIKIPSAPTAMPALAIVSISCGIPPVTPLVWFGCCSE